MRKFARFVGRMFPVHPRKEKTADACSSVTPAKSGEWQIRKCDAERTAWNSFVYLGPGGFVLKEF